MYEQLIKKALGEMIIGQIEHLSANYVHSQLDIERIRLPQKNWVDKDYEFIAVLLNSNICTVKRLFSLKYYKDHKQFSAKNKEKFATFLNFSSWTALEETLLLQSIEKINSKQLF